MLLPLHVQTASLAANQKQVRHLLLNNAACWLLVCMPSKMLVVLQCLTTKVGISDSIDCMPLSLHVQNAQLAISLQEHVRHLLLKIMLHTGCLYACPTCCLYYFSA